MIRRQIDQCADRRVERRRQIDLIGRALDNVYAIGVRRLERKDCGTDIAAELRIAPGRSQNVRGERGGRRLAVGAGDGDEWRCRSMKLSFAAEQLDVADDLD